MRPFLVILIALLLLLLAGSFFYPRIVHVSVSGNSHHSAERIMEISRVKPGAPLLWVNRWSLADLENDPWIERARVIRHWPDTVSVTVWERAPVLTDGVSAWAPDGTLLPGIDPQAHPDLVLLRGWGEPRLSEALRLLDLLSDFDPRVISYSPEGFDIELAESGLFTPDAAMLERHWAAWVSQRGSRVAVYPWGVSERDE